MGEEISLTNDVNQKLNDLKTPVKAEKQEMTEEQKQKKLQDLNRKIVERCGEMGIDVKKIPIGTLMEGLRLSIKTIEEGMSIQVHSNKKIYFHTDTLFRN